MHISISNVERNLLRDHHKIKEGYLQSHLNEFVYKQTEDIPKRNFLIGLLLPALQGYDKLHIFKLFTNYHEKCFFNTQLITRF